MTSIGLRDHDILDVTLNFGVWKDRLSLLLEENGIKDYATIGIVVPRDATQLATYKKDDVKARRIILIVHIARYREEDVGCHFESVPECYHQQEDDSQREAKEYLDEVGRRHHKLPHKA